MLATIPPVLFNKKVAKLTCKAFSFKFPTKKVSLQLLDEDAETFWASLWISVVDAILASGSDKKKVLLNNCENYTMKIIIIEFLILKMIEFWKLRTGISNLAGLYDQFFVDQIRLVHSQSNRQH